MAEQIKPRAGGVLGRGKWLVEKILFRKDE